MSTATTQRQLQGIRSIGYEDYIDDREIFQTLRWLDEVTFSERKRRKVSLPKDFADGVMLAEVIKHYLPKMVELHNYPPASSISQRLSNWHLLNGRVLKRLNMELSEDVIRALAHEKPRVIERILIILRLQIDKFLNLRQGKTSRDLDLQFIDKPEKDRLKSETGKQDSADKSTKNNSQATHKDSKGDPDMSKALVPINSKNNTGRSSPAKSPRKTYRKGEIPHNHPDRSTYFDDGDLRYSDSWSRYWSWVNPYARNYTDKKITLFDTGLPFYNYLYRPDHVPRVLMEEKEMELMEKNETITMLNAKIRNLEQLLDLKQNRIEQLHEKIIQMKGVYYVTAGNTRKILR